MSNPEASQELPGDQPEASQDLPGDQPEVNQDLPEEQPPKGSGANRGKSEEARANAPGQQKKDDPNTYPDPENPPRVP